MQVFSMVLKLNFVILKQKNNIKKTLEAYNGSTQNINYQALV